MLKEVPEVKVRIIPKEFFLGIEVLERNGLSLKNFRRLTKSGGDDKAKRIIEILNEPVSKYHQLIKEWEEFYLKYFNIKIDLKKIEIPAPPKQEKRLLIIVPALSVDRVIKSKRKHYSVVMALSGPPAKLSNEITHHAPYAAWVAESINPHRKMRGTSALWAKENNVSGETLLERLLHDFKYWDETGKHLDHNYLTICSSSRFANGFVPLVAFDQDNIEGIIITQCEENKKHPHLGHRQVFRL
ncbi:MAG: hypothetical protein ACOYL8_02615 [Patescibacteria group bacterium]